MKKILLVDDEREFIEMIKTRLEANNYEVISAYDGNQGIEKAKDEKPDLILLDMMMPDLTGAQVLKILEENPETKDIPVIILTAIVSDEELAGQDANITGKNYPAVAKTANSQKLLDAVSKHLG